MSRVVLASMPRSALASRVAAVAAIPARPRACFRPLSRYLMLFAKRVGRRPLTLVASRRRTGVFAITPVGEPSAHAVTPTRIPRSAKDLTRMLDCTGHLAGAGVFWRAQLYPTTRKH